MKKSLLALAVLGAFTGVASAQSSVSLYGTVDLSGKYVKNDGSQRRFSLSQDGINSSQLGFRGTEDLGGGLKAGFLLLAGVNADSGTFGTQNGTSASGAKFFNRRSTLSLMGGFGEVRLGRDYTPTFWNNTIFDAFGTNGLGDSTHVQQLGIATFVRADNSIGYFLPSNLGGVYGQFMAAAGEGGTSTASVNPGRYLGGRVGFATGPFDVAAAYASQRILGGDSQKTWNVGGTYDLGVVKILAYYDRDTVASRRDSRGSVSGVVPIGQGEIHLGYSRSKATGIYSFDSTIDQFAAGYVYNLSKRTALYGTVARLSNKNNSATTGSVNSVSSGSSITAAPTLGGRSNGAEIGVRHFF